MKRSLLLLLCVAAPTLSTSLAFAAPPKATPAPSPAAPPPVAPAPTPASTSSNEDEASIAAKQAEAKEFFDRGLALYEKEAWDAALGEFVRSRKALNTRSATKYAASCLRALQRYDEALDLFEELLAFPNLSAKDRAFGEQGVADVTPRVGSVTVTGGEKGMSLVIDGRFRGTLPLEKALRVTSGTHELGAFKDGRDPFGVTVEVPERGAAVAQLNSLATGGRLKIAEQKQRVLDVLIDGVVVGKTPWEGALAVGEHYVALRGHVSSAECVDPSQTAAIKPKDAASVEVGTQPVTVPIRLRELTNLNLMAEELDTVLRVDPMPGGAQIAVDSVVVGHGAWEGRLRVGEHKVEITADGFLPKERRLTLAHGKRTVMAVELDHDPNTSEWRASRNRWAGAAFGVGAVGLGVFGVSGGLALSRALDLRAACNGNVCPPSQADNLSASHTFGVIATVGLVTGLLGAAGGTIILLTAKPASVEHKGPDDGIKITAGVDGVYGTF